MGRSVCLHCSALFAVCTETSAMNVQVWNETENCVDTQHIPYLHQVYFNKCTSHEKSESNEFNHVENDHDK